MTFRTHPIDSARRIAILCGLATTAIGTAVLGGWAFDVPALKSIFPGLATMKANTAAGLLLCGTSLALLSRADARGGVRAAVALTAACVIAVVVATLSQDVVGWNLGIDELLFRDATGAVEATSPGRIPPSTAFCLLLAGTALAVASCGLTTRLRVTILLGLATSMAIIGALGILGHASMLALGLRWWNHAGMAIHSAAGFVLLGAGLLALANSRYQLKWTFDRTLTAAVVVGIFLLVAAAALSYSYTVHLRDDTARIDRNQEVLGEIVEIEARLANLESSQRGFIITGDEFLLRGRQRTIRELHEHVATAQALAANDPVNRQSFDIAGQLIGERIGFGEGTIDVRRRLGIDPARRLVASGKGVELTRRITEVLETARNAEQVLLGERRRQSESVAVAWLLLLPIGTYLSLTILLLALFMLNAAAIERSRADEARSESESRYREVVEQASDGIFISDAQGNFVLVNTRGCELLGYTPEELVGMNGRVTYLEEDRDDHGRRMAEVGAGNVLRFERMVRRKDGSAFPAEISIKKLENGLVQVIFHDITERRAAQLALVAERTLLRTLIDALPDVVFTKDRSGRFTMCNRAGYENSGFDAESGMLGKTVFDLYPREMAAKYHADDLSTLAGTPVINREELSRNAAGVPRWFLTIKVPLRGKDDKIAGMVGISRDITERKQNEEKIERLHRIKSMLSAINSAIVRIHDPDELFTEACRIATEIGKFPIVLIGMLDSEGQLDAVSSGGAGAALLAALPPGARGGARGAALRSIRERSTVIENDILRDPDVDPIRQEAIARGCRSVISLPLYRENEPIGMVMLYGRDKDAFDDEETKLLEEVAGDVSFALTFIAQRDKANYLAYYDPLTGLPNRSLLFDQLARQLGTAGRDRRNVALVLLDIDRFRMVNDTLGRAAGDELLKAVSERIKGAVRDEDTIARTSADGFAIAASGTWRAEELAHLVESRNRKLFQEPFSIGGEELRMSATAGIALFPQDAATPESLVADAEAALRSAKAQSVPLMFYGPEMNARAAESLRMENRLRRALENRELALWYQPKVDLRSGKLGGLEALMRWNDPEAGMVPPIKFIPIMEQTGLILEAGNWALLKAAHDCHSWRNDMRAPLRIAVNVSPMQVRAREFVANVIAAAEAIEQAGGALDLEITESVIMENVDAIIPKLQTVRGLGVHIHVDDFGTGYSSLAYIARLPIHSLKIDRSFVTGMTQTEENLGIVKSIISLAHSLKLRVIAEGVETQAQSDLLTALSCDECQGYYFSRPAPPQDIPPLLKKFS